MSQTCYKTIACLLSATLIVATLILFSAFGDDQDNTKVFLILVEIFIFLMICPGWFSVGIFDYNGHIGAQPLFDLSSTSCVAWCITAL